MELKKIKDLVIETLKQGETFRENDDQLYYAIIVKIMPETESGLIGDMPIRCFFANRKRLGLPSFESVRRSRAKIMEEHPELKPCEKVQKGREIQREKYYDMAKNWKDLKQQSFSF